MIEKFPGQARQERHSREREQQKKHPDREWWRGEGPGIRGQAGKFSSRRTPNGLALQAKGFAVSHRETLVCKYPQTVKTVRWELTAFR